MMVVSFDAWAVPLSDVDVDDEILLAVRDAVASGWWSMGPRVEAFEEAFAELVSTRHAFAVANGTAALHLALLAVGCGAGDEVIVPSLNFVAAANTIVHAGATPVFCDVKGAQDLNLDPADVAQAVTPRTRAIVALHYGGTPCDVNALQAIAKEHELAIVEDAAHAPGASYHGSSCGTLGDIGCFSFFSNKNLPLGEGGMITTDDDALAEQLRLLRSHGMTTLTWDRHRGHAHSYDVVLPGFNYRLDEIRAAIGLVQLGRLAAGNEARGRLSLRYRERFRGSGVVVPDLPEDGVTSAHHLFVVVLPDGVDRDAVRASLVAERIQTSVHYPPIHRFSAYEHAAGRAVPETDALASRVLTLPLYPSMSEAQVDHVAAALLEAVPAGRQAVLTDT
jgi:dTDP-4-amino-4,6-dideoxygalactose transaminase